MSTFVLAVDPGNIESAWALVDTLDVYGQPIDIGKRDNEYVRQVVRTFRNQTVAIEMVASYGMAVGATVFETCVEIGRFVELAPRAKLVYRADIKLHHCRAKTANDSNIKQALIDRFAPHATNHGKGTKKQPGWFYGFKADIWQAYALAVYVADTTREKAA